MTNREFGKFVRATIHETEAEKFGWSFVLASFLPDADMLETADVDPEAVSFCFGCGFLWVFVGGGGMEVVVTVCASDHGCAHYVLRVCMSMPGSSHREQCG